MSLQYTAPQRQPSSVEMALSLAAQEAMTRLQDPDRREKIADHVLFRLMNDLTKAHDLLTQEEEVKTDYSVIEQVPSLPKKRGISLLEEAIGRIKADLELHEQALADLRDKEN